MGLVNESTVVRFKVIVGLYLPNTGVERRRFSAAYKLVIFLFFLISYKLAILYIVRTT